MEALDIGSGHNPVSKSGWRIPGDLDHLQFTNMDGWHPDADVHHRFEQLPWPFPDNSFSQIFARHTLEHVPRAVFIDVMKEIHRVATDGAYVHIRVPYWNSESFAGDPTHWNMFCETTFRHFCHGGSLGTDYYVPPLFLAAKIEFRFQPKFRFLPKRVLKELMHILCGVCDEMWVDFEVIKHPVQPWMKYHPRYMYSWNVPTPRFTALLYGGAFWGSLALIALNFIKWFL